MKFYSEKVFWFFCLLIMAYACYCYNPFVLFFQNDDFIHIPLSATGKILQRNSFRPVCDLLVIADYWLWKKNAKGYHATNLLLHITCCFLAYQVAKKVIEKYFTEVDALKTALLIAVLFFIYCTHSEAVLWILGRSGIIGLLFSLLFLLCYINRAVSIKWKVGYVAFLSLALLTYESTFILPVICIYLLFINKIQKDGKNVLIVFSVFIVYLIIRIYVTGEVFGTYEFTNVQDSLIMSVCKNYLKLLARSFMPAYTQPIMLLLAFGGLIALLIVFFFKAQSRKLLILFSVYLVSLLPYISLGIDAHGYEGERYLYFPTFCLSIFIVLLVQIVVKKKLLANALFLIILLIHTVSLSISASNFRLAGKVNKMVMTSIKDLAAKDSIYTYDLPQAQNGALMLRDGFKEGVEWYLGKELPKITVVSKRSELEPLSVNYKTVFQKKSADEDFTKTTALYFTDSVLIIKE